ncbi:TonB-dependent receptor plug domain-containing protein [Mucilaginibacter puniceus]
MRFSEVNKLRQILLLPLFFWCVSAQAQRITDPLLKNIVKTTLSTYEKKPFEKLYVQTDKPVYLTGDTLRLKAYLLNGDYRFPSALSGILYVELDNEGGKNIKRMMLPVSMGLAWADIALDTAEVKQGNYTLRAYTNWMRNFGEDYIFKKNITVSAHQGNPVLVSSLFEEKGKQVETALQFRMLNGQLMSFKDVELKLMSGKKNVSKDKFTTDPDGKVKLNFAMPDGNEPLSIKAMIAGNAELTIPVTLPRPQNMDVQFMPEGGTLVAGIPVKIGIKAIGENGMGINVSGKLYNSKGNEVAVINTTYKGMGSFGFTPQAGESYSAKINGKSYLLPAIKPAGTVLSVATKGDSLTLDVKGTTGVNSNYYLIGQARGVVCYAEPISLINGAVSNSIAKILFPTGITRFTLLNSAQQPVNERIVFINHKDELKLNIQPDKSNYTIRDSVSLTVNVTDKDGKPVQGSFSMAVTDNSQVSVDSLGSNILTNLLLTSDLKGEIEQPGYYFTGNKDAELDNLMLTQGWVGYDWKEILSPEPKPITYQPEKEYIVSGKVTNAFGKPMERSPIVLLGNKPVVMMDTLTGKDGRFIFRDTWPVDTAIFKLQARNKNHKEYNVTIKMDEQTFPEFTSDKFIPAPWYVNTDTTLLNNATSLVAEEKARKEYKGEGMELREVSIKAKKVVKGSKNLNGPGEADLVLDEQDMLKAGKKTLEELLFEKIPGIVLEGFWWKCNGRADECRVPMSYLLYGKRISLVFDGVDIDKYFFPDTARGKSKEEKDLFLMNERAVYIKNYLNYYTAEDVLGIELMEQPKYNRAYASVLLPGRSLREVPQFNKHAYIEITTRSKQGPFMRVTPGTYLYKPLAFTLPKQFYSPKYTVKNKNTAVGTDMRSTIFWQPNIITDAAGKATVSFYSADKTADYSVIVEGTDMSGGLGFGKKELKLNQ